MWTNQAIFSLAVLLWTSQGLATEPRCEEDPECHRLSFEGLSAHKERKDFAAAAEKFQAAYRRVQDPRLLISLGRSVYKLGNIAQAVELYNQAQPYIDNPRDQERLRRYVQEAEAARIAIAPPARSPFLSLAKDASTGTARLADDSALRSAPYTPISARLPTWRIGLGETLTTLALGSLVTAIASSAMHKYPGPMGACSRVGMETACSYDFTKLFVPTYVAAGVLAAGATLVFTLPTSSSSRKEIRR